eukprot:TRINITY_DN5236_c0_g1_i1.p1 TRINITY_DN5236_c0_g1~~TRINITY_DN5236_c0_g1_i1.p1  ORF type:complete len:202 (+),score=34.99 TRINITY_DN5236_c0_g1_i1:274-879(+)
MWRNWLNWRLNEAPDSIPERSILKSLMSGKAFWHKWDKKKQPCLIIKTKYHYPTEVTVAESLLFGIYLLEQGLHQAEVLGSGKVCVLWDREGFDRSKNFDSSLSDLMKQMTKVLQEYYAEVLDNMYILHANWFFKMMWAIVSPFINKRTRDKVKVIDEIERLKDTFDVDCLLREHGGTSDYVYTYTPVSYTHLTLPTIYSV